MCCSLSVICEAVDLVISFHTLRSFQHRLLHPGANTSDIITQYISAIRALGILDHSGVVLEQVCDPVRTYLRLAYLVCLQMLKLYVHVLQTCVYIHVPTCTVVLVRMSVYSRQM